MNPSPPAQTPPGMHVEPAVVRHLDDLFATAGLGAVGYDGTAQMALRHRLRNAIERTAPALAALYPHRPENEVAFDLVSRALAAAADRKYELRAQDTLAAIDREWFQSHEMVGYVAYAEQFGPTIADVAKHLDYLEELGVRYFHLMNVIESRPAPNDGGFAVTNYRNVDQTLGTINDLEALADELRARNIALCLDVVMNHTAAEHEWAKRARAGEQRYRNYYLVFPDRTEPDAFEASLPEVFPELAPGNFTWDDDLNGWVWTTFNTYQWDLNYANPQVLGEMLDINLFLANRGVQALRLDAVAFTWKRKGTNCQNQPEAHLIAQVLRAFVEAVAPSVILKAEAIVGPRELTTYLGAHSIGIYNAERPECHIGYHNQLMVNIWSALATRDAVLFAEAMRNLPQTPSQAGWATYVRCHDDIGWAIDDGDARNVGKDGSTHRRFLAQFYRGDFPGSFAHGVPFSANKETGDERTCGTTAALTGLSHARKVNDSTGASFGIRRALLAYGLACSFGMPLIYMGDEIALDNDLSYLQNPTRADDSRWLHRPPMDWVSAENRNELGTVEHLMFSGLQRLVRIRSNTPALHQGGDVYILQLDAPEIFGFIRRHPSKGVLLGLANVSEHDAGVPAAAFGWAGLSHPYETLLTEGVRVVGDRIVVPALSLAWFVESNGFRVVPSA
jgi:amylosucrase